MPHLDNLKVPTHTRPCCYTVNRQTSYGASREELALAGHGRHVVLEPLTSRELGKWCLPKTCSMGLPLLWRRSDILLYRYSVMLATWRWMAVMPPRRSIMPKPCCSNTGAEQQGSGCTDTCQDDGFPCPGKRVTSKCQTGDGHTTHALDSPTALSCHACAGRTERQASTRCQL